MYPFVIVLSLLLFFSYFTTKEVAHFVFHRKEEKLFIDLQKKQESQERIKEKIKLHEIKTLPQNKEDLTIEKRKKSAQNAPKKKKCYKLNFDTHRPPNNSRFNLYTLLFDEEKKEGVKTKKEIFEALLLKLYGEAPFFQEIPSLEKEIANRLLDEKELFREKKFPDEIAVLSFDSPKVREAFYLMLKGDEHFPSLFLYLTLDKKVTRETKKINLLFASFEMIDAVLDKPKAAERLFLAKEELLSEIQMASTPLTRQMIKERLTKEFATILTEENLIVTDFKKYFDFSLGKPGTILIMQDPITKKTIREKLVSGI